MSDKASVGLCARLLAVDVGQPVGDRPLPGVVSGNGGSSALIELSEQKGEVTGTKLQVIRRHVEIRVSFCPFQTVELLLSRQPCPA